MNKKLGLRMAQGGLVQGDERAALYAKYGIKPGGSAPAPQAAPQRVAQAPAPAQKPQAGGLLNQATSALTGRRRQLEEAMNYAEGGIVRGKGGPTDDEVPMRVAGKDVNLSNTEAVLPAKTVQALGGPKAVEALIEQTNGKPPVKGGLRQGGSYENGTVAQPKQEDGLKAPWWSPAYATAARLSDKSGLELERERRASAGSGDVMRSVLTTGTTGQSAPPPAAKPAPVTPTTPAAQPEAKEFDTNLMQTLGVAAQQNGGQANFNSQKDATEYSPAAGTGVITRQPGEDGLRSATFVGGPSAADAARDKQFAEAGYGKDAYGNWMTPSRIADQQKVAAIEARDAKAQAARDARDAENYKAMQQAQANRDPNSTLNSMRDDRMISDLVERTKYGKRSERANATSMLNNLMSQRSAAAIAQQRMAHEGGLARERMGHDSKLSQQKMEFDGKYRDQELGLRAQEIGSLDSYRQSSLQNDAQKTAATSRAAAQANYIAASKEQREMVGAYLDKLVPTTGLKGDDLKAALSRRAQMEEAFWKANGGNMSLDPQQLQRELGSAGDAANLTLAKNEAVTNPSPLDRVRNLMNGNKDRNTTMYSTNTVVTEDGRRFNMPGGPSLRTASLGPNADLLAKQEQINQQYAEQERLRNLAANQ